MDNLTPQNKTDVLPFGKRFTGDMPAKIKALIFGKNGIGKTYCVRDIVESGKKVLFLNFEKDGLRSIQNFTKNNSNIEVYDFSLEDLIMFVNKKGGEYIKKFDVLFVDSITSIYRLIELKHKNVKGFEKYRAIGEEAIEIYDELLKLDIDVFITGHSTINDNNDTELRIGAGKMFNDYILNPINLSMYLCKDKDNKRMLITEEGAEHAHNYNITLCKKRDERNLIKPIMYNITELWSEE